MGFCARKREVTGFVFERVLFTYDKFILVKLRMVSDTIELN